MNQFVKLLCLAGTVTLLSSNADAQQSGVTETKPEREIIIRKKTDKDTKVTIEINGDEVRVNGKPLSEFDDKNIEIDLETIRPRSVTRLNATRSPFRGSTWNMESPQIVTGYGINSNKAVLGVTTEKDDAGARVKTVTKGSGAEKAGIKEGDVITAVGDVKVSNPEELSKAMSTYKPEDKVDVRYRRDKKDQKVTATLSKPSSTTVYSQNFNYDYKQPELRLSEAQGMYFGDGNQARVVIGSPAPKLGIKAQDTEDGKGVTVLGVDENSAAQKSGLKEGDLITEFDGKAVNDATELMQAARSAKDKNNMKVKFTRGGKSQELDIKIPKKLKTANL